MSISQQQTPWEFKPDNDTYVPRISKYTSDYLYADLFIGSHLMRWDTKECKWKKEPIETKNTKNDA